LGKTTPDEKQQNSWFERIPFFVQEAACTDIRFGAENNIFGEGEQLDKA